MLMIRTDGNSKIATGHVMRCLSIARAYSGRGGRAAFAVSDRESMELLWGRFAEKDEFPIYVLDSNYERPDEELPRLLSLLTSCSASCLLIDSYYASVPYLAALRKAVFTAYLDDLYFYDCPADLIINYDVLAGKEKEEELRKRYASAGCALLGASYAPLRPEFAGRRYQVRKAVTDILISTGGTDPYQMALKLAGLLSADRRFRLHILTGRMSSCRNRLIELSADDSSLILYENISEMAELMSRCDLAVTAAGTTLYELCAVGVPSVCYSFADNQISCARAFDEAGAVPYAGDLRSGEDVSARICSRIGRYCLDPADRLHTSARMQALIDAEGAARIANFLLTIS